MLKEGLEAVLLEFRRRRPPALVQDNLPKGGQNGWLALGVLEKEEEGEHIPCDEDQRRLESVLLLMSLKPQSAGYLLDM